MQIFPRFRFLLLSAVTKGRYLITNMHSFHDFLPWHYLLCLILGKRCLQQIQIRKMLGTSHLEN